MAKNTPARNSVRLLNDKPIPGGATEQTPHGKLYIGTPEHESYTRSREIAETFRSLVSGLRTHEWNRRDATARIRAARVLLADTQPTAANLCDTLAHLFDEGDPNRMAAMTGNLIAGLQDAVTRLEFAESAAAAACPRLDPLVRNVPSAQRDGNATAWRPRVPGDDE